MSSFSNGINNGANTPVIFQNTDANKPTAPLAVGSLFVSQTSNILQRWDGSGWVTVGGSGSTPTLQQVTTAGNTTTDQIILTGPAQLYFTNGGKAGELYANAFGVNLVNNTDSVSVVLGLSGIQLNTPPGTPVFYSDWQSLAGSGAVIKNSAGTTVAIFGSATTTNGSVVGGWNVGGNLAVTGTSVFTDRIGIGALLAGANFFNNRNLTGSPTGRGFALVTTIQPDVTNIAVGYQSFIQQAAGFTTATVQHFLAGQGTFSGTVTTQAGFEVATSLTGAATNYGFRGQIPSGANRWNNYHDGTAANYFQGNTTIGSTANPISAQLYVTGVQGISSTTSLPLSLYATGASIGTQIFFQNNYATGYLGISADFRGDMAIQVEAAGTGTDKGVKINTAGNNTRIYASAVGNVGINTVSEFGGGTFVIGIANATVLPTTNPSGGGVLYVDAGALKYRGSSGTITTIANA